MIAPNLLDEKPLDLAAPNETDPSWACTLKSALQMLAQRRPLCLQKQTSQKRESMSALGQKRSFDYLVGAGENRFRNSQAESLGCFEIDDEIESHRLLDRHFGWLRAT